WRRARRRRLPRPPWWRPRSRPQACWRQGERRGAHPEKAPPPPEEKGRKMLCARIKGGGRGGRGGAAPLGAGGGLQRREADEHASAKAKHRAVKRVLKNTEKQPARPKQQPAKSDQERMVGNWFIMNDDSMRKGEMWVIYEDFIRMHAKDLTPIMLYSHRL